VRFIQPYPQLRSSMPAPADAPLPGSPRVRFVRYRYPHHSAPSGYDRLCDYTSIEEVRLPRWLYLLGETLLRPIGMALSRFGGIAEYQRYDFTMELAVVLDMLRSRSRWYHFIYAEKSCMLAARLVGWRGHRLIGTVHHPEIQQRLLFRDRTHFRAFEALICMDEESVASWRGVTGRQNVVCVPYGVDASFFRPLDHERSDGLRLVFAGSHLRDFDVLQRVVAATCDARSDIHWDLIGRHECLGRMASLLPNVTHHARVDDYAYRSLLARADLLVLPLEASTTCGVVLEAIACGTPVVTNLGGIETYLDSTCAVFCPVGDVASMVSEILRLADAQQQLARMREAARSRAMLYSWPAVAAQHVELFERVMCGAQSSQCEAT